MVVNEITSSVQKSSAKSILMGAIIALTGFALSDLAVAWNNTGGHDENATIENGSAEVDSAKDPHASTNSYGDRSV